MEKFNCHDKIPWHFPDISQMAKIPWHFFKIPWQFPDLEKILFFPDFSLTRGNPACRPGTVNLNTVNPIPLNSNFLLNHFPIFSGLKFPDFSLTGKRFSSSGGNPGLSMKHSLIQLIRRIQLISVLESENTIGSIVTVALTGDVTCDQISKGDSQLSFSELNSIESTESIE